MARGRSLPNIFLCLDNVESFVGDPEPWWGMLRDRAAGGQFIWSRVIEAMSEFSCLVEAKSKPGVGWVTVPAEKEDRQSAEFVHAQGLSKGPRGGKGQRKGKTISSGSGLRYEVENH